ncbi:tetratricopeptide repeat protein [Azospirillum sp. RWY-5-1]|uniref:Tetratricopeptide repeat protein n=1 Tax=Azospirillum oleiclasticum TaxID=2735135 RepID=A0ABX2TBC8_9PROT|nr:WavE lipopolysaccharide synthesis family protein [Azospirillum oleiclasticum]NYZ12840.1 tetratricopeptide repeat protein [Azospirillum oleiclasticum]NYZ20000.1 tetratricopeptide repeat protein [Azospirillum oleiclasticum]
MIAPDEVSVVVQGPWDPEHTPRCLDSVAMVLPGAEVILSVWKAPPAFDTAGVRADTVILNADPGDTDLTGLLDPAQERRTLITRCNINRQILSTRNALAVAGRAHALKLRSDMALDHAGFLAHAARFRGIDGPCRVFGERIVTTSARSPRRSFTFFVQDFCSFGRLEDMRRLWAAPLFPPRDALLAMPMAERAALLLVPEQHLVLSALRPVLGGTVPSNALDRSPALVELSERALAGNFVCLDAHRLGVRALKPSLQWINLPEDLRLHWLWVLTAGYGEFLSWCRRHCGEAVDPIIAECGEEYATAVADVAVKASLIPDGERMDGNRLMELGVQAHAAGRLDDAAEAYATLLAAEPDHPRVNLALGALLLQRGETDAGRQRLDAAVRGAPGLRPTCEALMRRFAPGGAGG